MNPPPEHCDPATPPTEGNVTTRRQWLKRLTTAGVAAAAGVLANQAGAGVAWAQAQSRAAGARLPMADFDFHIARVRFDCNVVGTGARWNVYPGAERYLLEECARVLRSRIHIPTGAVGVNPVRGTDDMFSAVVSFDDFDSLVGHPFALMTGEGAFSFSTSQLANVKRYLDEGGFLLIDDCVLGIEGDLLFQSAVRMLERAYGRGSLVRLPNSHEIFRSAFDLTSIGLPHCQGRPHGAHALMRGDRIAALVSPHDIHCGWVDRGGVWFPGPAVGPHAHREAIQMGVNIITYALTR